MSKAGATTAPLLIVAALVAAMISTVHGLAPPPLPPLVTEDPPLIPEDPPSVVEPQIIDLDNDVPVEGVALLEFAFPDDPRFNYANILDVEILPFKAFFSRIVSCAFVGRKRRRTRLY